MKKLAKTILLSIIIGTCSISPLSAQNLLFDNPDNHGYLGVRLGYDINSADGVNNSENFRDGSGLNAGVIYNIPLFKNLYFEPGFSLFYNTIGLSRSDVNNSGELIYDSGTIHNFGFRVPLDFGYHFDFTEHMSVAVFTGPQLNVNLVAQQKYRNQRNSHSLFGIKNHESDGVYGGFKHWDMQWLLGASFIYDRIVLSLYGGIGMTNIQDNPVEKYRRNSFTVAIGYNF